MSLPDHQKDNSQNRPVSKAGTFAFQNYRIALIYYDTFFTDVYKKVFDQFRFETRCYEEISTESIRDITIFDPLVIVVIDDYLGKRVDYAKEVAFKIKNSEKTKMIPIVVTSDKPPSQVAADIIKIYALNQNQT